MSGVPRGAGNSSGGNSPLGLMSMLGVGRGLGAHQVPAPPSHPRPATPRDPEPPARPPALRSSDPRGRRAQTHPARCRRPTLLSRKCRLSAWSFFISGSTVQPGFRPRFSTACEREGRAGLAELPAMRPGLPGPAARQPPAYLQQGVGGHLQHHGVLRHVPQRLLEQHGAHQVVDVVLCGGRAGQAAVPLGLGDGGAEPARRAGPRVPDHLHRLRSGRAAAPPPTPRPPSPRGRPPS